MAAWLEITPPLDPRRQSRLAATVRALEAGPLRAQDLAGLVGCTITSVRRDLALLARAGVVAPLAAGRGLPGSQARFALSADADSAIGRLALGSAAVTDVVVRAALAGQDDTTEKHDQRDVPAGRDPLVAALFGKPGVAG